MAENKTLVPESSGGAEVIAGGGTLMKFQDETMMAVAIQRKRSIKEVQKAVEDEIQAFPDFADRYFYSIPHKTQKCDHATGRACPNCEYVEGPSIHAALALQRYWGNCSSSWAPLEETEDFFWCVGTFVDYERNTRFQKPFRCEKRFKKRNGEYVTLYGDRLAKAINAAGSKAQRNAILAGIPDPLKLMAFTVAKKLAVGDSPNELLKPSQIKAIENEFSKYEIDLAIIERKLGKKANTFTRADRARLMGLRNALVDGEAPTDIFGSTVKKTKSKPATTVTDPNNADSEMGEVPLGIATPPEAEVPMDGSVAEKDEPPIDVVPVEAGDDPFQASMFDE
jgi:hypothetical protein